MGWSLPSDSHRVGGIDLKFVSPGSQEDKVDKSEEIDSERK